MHDYKNLNTGDKINLREILVSIWAHKILVTFFFMLSIMIGSYYALSLEKIYTSTVSFKLNGSGDKKLNISPTAAAFSSFSGYGLMGATLPETQVYGQIFIQKINTKVDLQSDNFFNNYNPDAVEPIWKSVIKDAIGWKKPNKDVDTQAIIFQLISDKFKQNLSMELTDDNAIQISFTHINPERAASIANAIMSEIILLSKNKAEEAQAKKIVYLSNTLAKSLNDLETAQSNLKAFTSENSALPQESFAIGSLQLDTLREQLNKTAKLHAAVAELSSMLKNNTTSQENYLLLRTKHPIIDQVEFRRAMGQNEIISSWSWPKISTVAVIFDTLSQRINRLKADIRSSQLETQRSSKSLETFARLKREEEIAEATYTVLIEQVKSQSMMAGFKPGISEIFQYASPSVNPSSPNVTLIVMLWAVFGLFAGSAIALVIAVNRGVYYSRKSLLISSKARLNLNNRTLHSLRNKNLHEINAQIKKKSRPILRDITVEIHKSEASQVVVTSSRTKLNSYQIALTLALSMESKDTKIAVIDFSMKNSKTSPNDKQTALGAFVINKNEGHVSILRPGNYLNSVDFVVKKDFLKNIQSLESSFNFIFLCADNRDAVSLLRALEGQNIFHLTNARIKYTKSDMIKKMHSLLPIKGLLHD